MSSVRIPAPPIANPEGRPTGGVDPHAPFPGLLRQFFRSFGRKYKQCFDARFLTVDVPLDVEAANLVLPFGMFLTNPAKATLFVVEYRRPTFTDPYREAGMMLHVRTILGRGWHCCWMVLDDDDTAMIYGRETLGYPKKRARIEWEETEDGVRTSVTRRGVEVLSLEAVKTAHESEPGPIFDVKTFNVGGVGNFLAFSTAWCFRITETFRESRAADVQVKLEHAQDDPIASLVARQSMVVPGRFAATDITGLRYLVPAGIAGPRWFANTYFLRFR